MYTRDQLIALRCDDLPDVSVRDRVRQLTQLFHHRRGCHAGERLKRRLQLCHCAVGVAY